MKEENLMQSQLSAYLLVIVIMRKNTSCLIPVLLASRDVVFHEIANEGDKINNTSV